MNKYKEINIDDIVIQNERLWKIKDEQVQNLKKSIEEIGLMNPVTIQKRQDRYILIGGEHRYTACKQLGYKTIPCNIIPREYDNDEDEDARLVLMEVDENLVRRTADFIEESFLLNRRKIAYEKLNPLCVKQNKVKGNLKNIEQAGNADSIKTFFQDTREKTNMADRTISSRLRVGELISEYKKDLIKDNKVSCEVLNSIVVGKDKEDVKKASEIHLETIENMETDKNKNTIMKKAIKEVKKEIDQVQNPIEFAEKVQEIVPNIIEKEEKPKVDFSLNEDDLYEINELINTVPDADAIVVLVNGVEIYSKTKK
jgi:ParB family chromosome partitioning protein